MSIYIEGMEIPKDGSCIQIVIDDDGNIYPSVEECILKINSIAKAVTVPPHGRCVDARYIDSENDRFFNMSRASEEFDEHASAYAYSLIANMLANAPTIIPEEQIYKGE